MVFVESFDITTEVLIDKQALVEHLDMVFDDFNPHSDRKNVSRGPDVDPDFVQVSKYVEAQNEKEFEIRFKIGKKYPFKDSSTRVEVAVDGQFGDSRIVNKRKITRHHGYSDTITGRRQVTNAAGATSTYAFRFAKLNIVDEAEDEGNECHLGTIHIRFWRVESTRGGFWRKTQDQAQSANDRKVREKSLKKGQSVDAGTGFSNSAQGGKTWKMKVTYVDGKEYPFLDICFKCRGRASLQKLAVIPLSRSPTPFEMTNPHKMTDKEKIEAIVLLQGRLRAIKNDNSSRKIQIKDREGIDTALFSSGDGDICEQVTSRNNFEDSEVLEDDQQGMEEEQDEDEDGVVFLFSRTAEEARHPRPRPGDIIHQISDSENESDQDDLFYR